MDLSDDDVVEIVPPSPPPLPTQAANSLPQLSEGEITVAREVEVRERQEANTSGGEEAAMDEAEIVQDLAADDDETASGEDNSDVEILDVAGEEVEVIVEDTADSDANDADGNNAEPADANVQLNDPPSRPATPLPPELPSHGEASSTASPEEDASLLGERETGGTTAVLPAVIPSPARPQANTRGSHGDFRTPKRRKLMSPLKPTSAEEDEDDADSCPICFEPWTNSGKHRLASLRCGHLFGQSCIEKWLRGHGGKCPHCNAKAKRLDIRVIYAKSLKTLDTTERDRALEQVEKEKELRKKAELARAQARLHYQLAIEECNRLRSELDKARQQLQQYRSNPGLTPSTSGHSSQANKGQFKPFKVIKILETGGCRVLSYSASHATLVISQPSNSPLFPGFGVKKLNVMDFKTTQYMTVHSKPIRDLCFHPVTGDGFLLSGAMDKTVKLSNLMSSTVIQSYETTMPVWSCVWNTDDRNYFYAGQQNGTVLEFDIRNTQEFVQQLNTEGSRAPVVSLQYIPADQQSLFRPGGLLVGQLDRITFYERKSEEYKLHLFPADGQSLLLYFGSKLYVYR
ncbi:E3 ubiquitin-protein ligase rfwd3.L-like isoform X2 [Liolophura sinensis]|uniref:E3 ubiquitin-protein ligase rfwd3.L-like isoform X2 n=1 Tax=Liolophura sinensis TaxID=3198878 RepID=UPI0031592B97